MLDDIFNKGDSNNIQDTITKAKTLFDENYSKLTEAEKQLVDKIVKEIEDNKDNITSKVDGITDDFNNNKDKVTEIVKKYIPDKPDSGTGTGTNSGLGAISSLLPFVPFFKKDDKSDASQSGNTQNSGSSNSTSQTSAPTTSTKTYSTTPTSGNTGGTTSGSSGSTSGSGLDTSSVPNNTISQTQTTPSSSGGSLTGSGDNRIYFDFGKAEKDIQILSDCYVSLNRDVNELKGIIEDIGSYWSGTSQTTFVSKFEEGLNQLKIYNEFVQDGSDNMKTSSKSYQKLDEVFYEGSI